jgi:hypothetical protein
MTYYNHPELIEKIRRGDKEAGSAGMGVQNFVKALSSLRDKLKNTSESNISKSFTKDYGAEPLAVVNTLLDRLNGVKLKSTTRKEKLQ